MEHHLIKFQISVRTFTSRPRLSKWFNFNKALLFMKVPTTILQKLILWHGSEVFKVSSLQARPNIILFTKINCPFCLKQSLLKYIIKWHCLIWPWSHARSFIVLLKLSIINPIFLMVRSKDLNFGYFHQKGSKLQKRYS